MEGCFSFSLSPSHPDKVINRSVVISLLDLGAGRTMLYTRTIGSASIFALVALVLSMYLLFEHLSAYNQPEELFPLPIAVDVLGYEFKDLQESDESTPFPCELR